MIDGEMYSRPFFAFNVVVRSDQRCPLLILPSPWLHSRLVELDGPLLHEPADHIHEHLRHKKRTSLRLEKTHDKMSHAQFDLIDDFIPNFDDHVGIHLVSNQDDIRVQSRNQSRKKTSWRFQIGSYAKLCTVEAGPLYP